MQRIDVDAVRGVFAIMPTPAAENGSDPRALDTLDLVETRRAVDALIADGVDALMINGTFGEGATLTYDEAMAFARAVVDETRGRVPVIAGATTLNTRDTIARARVLSDTGVSGLLLGRPMWSPCDDTATVGFYRDVAEAVPELGIVIYDNPISFRGKISPAAYAQLAKIPQIVAAKYPVLGPSFLADRDAVGDAVRLLPVERDWYHVWLWDREGALACWSGSASCGPAAATALRDALAAGDESTAKAIARAYGHASRTFFPQGSFELFSTYNVQLEKIRINEAGYINAGPPRPPYTQCPPDFAEGARESGRRLASLHATWAAVAAEGRA